MIKRLYYRLLVLILLFSSILGLMIKFRQTEVTLLYVSDYGNDDFYTVLDVETGKTLNFRRPVGFQGIYYGGEGPVPERQDITSPYDETVRFVILRDFNATNREDEEQLYRVRENDQFEPVLSGEHIYVFEKDFTDNGRYVYLFKKSGSGLQYVLYTLYRYDIQSAELTVVTGDVPGAGLNCQMTWCQVISGIPGLADSPQTLFVLHKNSGELREVVTADEITIRFWWGQNEFLYAAYDGLGQAVLSTYSIESNQHHILAELPGQGVASIYRQNRWGNSPHNNEAEDWLLVLVTSPENTRIFDMYVVNNLTSNPTTYPFHIQTSNASWLFYELLPDSSILLTTLSSEDEKVNNVYIINDMTTQPIVDELTNADFDAMSLGDVRLEINLGDTQLIRASINKDEWRYYMINVATRTITPLAVFNKRQQVIETRLSADKKWLAVSMQEMDKYYVVVVPLDGSQAVQKWNVGAESYICLLSWYAPDVAPPPCDLYFGIG